VISSIPSPIKSHIKYHIQKVIYRCHLKFYQLAHKIKVLLLENFPYFDAVLGLGWSNDPDNSVATGRASHARQVIGYDPDKKGYPGTPS
jgi:hypothetical protein